MGNLSGLKFGKESGFLAHAYLQATQKVFISPETAVPDFMSSSLCPEHLKRWDLMKQYQFQLTNHPLPVTP